MFIWHIFQLTASQGGWRLFHTAEQTEHRYFNSHPHKEDDDNQSNTGNKLCISTHILTRRMTYSFMCTGEEHYISTHILTKRMTMQVWETDSTINISTHILTKRMTPRYVTFPVCVMISTHILTKRMTLHVTCPLFSPLFQLTSSRRGWPFP